MASPDGTLVPLALHALRVTGRLQEGSHVVVIPTFSTPHNHVFVVASEVHSCGHNGGKNGEMHGIKVPAVPGAGCSAP